MDGTDRSLLDKISVCAVVVTWQPDDGLSNRIERIAQNVGLVVIVDNGSSEDCLRTLRSICDKVGSHLITNSHNEGIAKASNQGIDHAAKLGYKWVLMLDDDSLPSASMVQEQLAVYDSYPDKERVGIIAANPIDSVTGHGAYVDQCGRENLIEQTAAIASGSLLLVSVHHEIGPFREDLFVDGVDQEYCLRLRANGYKVLLACRAHLLHSLGRPTRRKLLWRSVVPTNHSFVRRYYMARNRVIIAKSYFKQEPAWIARQFVALFKSVILVLLFEVDKRRKLKSTIIGICHGIIGKAGQYSSSEYLTFHRS